jgi:hypothetical protein
VLLGPIFTAISYEYRAHLPRFQYDTHHKEGSQYIDIGSVYPILTHRDILTYILIGSNIIRAFRLLRDYVAYTAELQ